jgi:hypothetical protein
MILNHWREEETATHRLLVQLQTTSELPTENITERREAIEQHLSGVNSQIFEVVSFAVLHVYFFVLGFSLRRFSTTFANDGGMDFISERGIYQVTTGPTRTKIERDVAKLPKTARVLVAPAFSDTLRIVAQAHSTVLELIDRDDLRCHFLHWLYKKDVSRGAAFHMQCVVKKALSELKREIG